jgi:hypothetical protein
MTWRTRRGSLHAQDRSKEPMSSQEINGKTTSSCKADIHKFCEGANLKQECLVAHWTGISSDCQDVLATPMRGTAVMAPVDDIQ